VKTFKNVLLDEPLGTSGRNRSTADMAGVIVKLFRTQEWFVDVPTINGDKHGHCSVCGKWWREIIMYLKFGAGLCLNVSLRGFWSQVDVVIIVLANGSIITEYLDFKPWTVVNDCHVVGVPDTVWSTLRSATWIERKQKGTGEGDDRAHWCC
jgi:hypothetical protein